MDFFTIPFFFSQKAQKGTEKIQIFIAFNFFASLREIFLTDNSPFTLDSTDKNANAFLWSMVHGLIQLRIDREVDHHFIFATQVPEPSFPDIGWRRIENNISVTGSR